MKFLQFVVSLCLFASQVICQETLLIELTDERPTIKWTPTSTEDIEVYADNGYQIQIDIVQFDVDGESDNSVTIRDDPDDGDVQNEMLLTYVVSGNPRYLYNKNKLQADYFGNNTSNQVEIEFTRVGEFVTTTTIIPTTTEESMPTPSSNDGSTLTVYLYGQSAGSFGESEIKSLRGAIAKMGTEYCSIQNCPLNNSITWKNVQIEMLEQCSVMWEDYDACFILTFALPIVKSEDNKEPLWDGYQLSESHLRILWDTYGSKYMGQIGLSLYAVPDLNVIFKYRIIIIVAVIVLVIILVLSARHVAGKIHKKRRRLSDTICIMDRPSDRTSQQSLPPHYLQELPPHLARNYMGNYPEYNLAFADDEEKSGPASIIATQISISNDTNDLEDAHA